MVCNACGEKPKKSPNSFPNAVIEINNPENLVLLRKVVIPTSLGDETSIPPEIGKYSNVILYYEATGNIYLYSSDGIPTAISSNIPQEIWDKISTLEQEYDSLANVAKSGSYSDLLNTPTIGDATITFTRNNSEVGEFTTNATSATTINIDVPTNPSDIGAQSVIDSNNKISSDLVDDSNATNKFVTSSDLTTLSTALQPSDIDEVVMTDIDLNANTSTTTVQLDAAKKNLMSGTTTTKSIALPVASSLQAGVMNASTFDAITSNTNNINALLNGAVAVTGLSASPSQSDITTAWQTATGLTTLINRASVYDVTNSKVWTYYSNDTTWHEASNTTQVTVNQATNSSLGTVMGSTNTGQAFVENDGTLSVNGWDTLSNNVSTNTSNITSLGNSKQDKLTAGANITISSGTISATDTIPTVDIGTVLSTPSNVAYVDTANLVDGAVTTAKIDDGAITASKTDFGGDFSTSEVDTGFTWIDGSHIYKKTVDTGALPNASIKNVPHGISNLSNVIKLEGYASDTSSWVPLPLTASSATYNVQVSVSPTNVTFDTGVDRSNFTESYITLYYTKTS